MRKREMDVKNDRFLIAGRLRGAAARVRVAAPIISRRSCTADTADHRQIQ